MTTREGARILIGIPAYRGTLHVAETLRSIQAQEFRDWRGLISVDGGDRDTADACRAFLSDPRFSLVMHEDRLGWDGNIDWLMAQTTSEFFCYWQQDDLASADYLAALIAAADANPAAVCVYSDIQWFGAATMQMTCPSVTGFARERAWTILEAMNGVPFRGLIRRGVLARTGPIGRNPHESAYEDFAWVARLAREGNLLRVPGPLYFKRKHADATSTRWEHRDAAWKRGAWIDYGLAMLEVLWPVVPVDERHVALAIVLDRLCSRRVGRHLFYDPGGEIPAFAADFLAQERRRFPVTAVEAAIAAGGTAPRFAGGPGGDLLDRVLQWPAWCDEVRHTLAQAGVIELAVTAGSRAVDLLGPGWSWPEPWGTWSEAPAATLRLPLPDGGRWRAAITCLPFGAGRCRPRSVTVAVDGGGPSATWRFVSDDVVVREIVVASQRGDTVLRFGFPDAVSPHDLGTGRDTRLLGLGLVKIAMSREGAG